MRKTGVIAVAVGLLAMMMCALGIAQALSIPVTVTVEGKQVSLRTFAHTVEELLRSRGLSVGEHDTVTPGFGERLRPGMDIRVRYGRQISLTVDGSPRRVWTTATKVDEAMRELDLSPAARLSVPRDTAIGRDGTALSVTLPVAATLRVHGGPDRQVEAHGTVADALRAAGVTAGPDDRITPAPAEPLVAGAVIVVTEVKEVEVTRAVPVPFKATKKPDPAKAKGYEKVEQAGVNGESTEVWVQHLEDGKVVREEKRSATVTKPAVDEVRVVGVQVAGPVSSGARDDVMAAAGIAPGDFGYVEKLIQRESGWNPSARNPSGACGLVQALPCSKLGPNWQDPVHALQWGDSYVKGRYGSWAGAWAHSQSTGWY